MIDKEGILKDLTAYKYSMSEFSDVEMQYLIDLVKKDI